MAKAKLDVPRRPATALTGQQLRVLHLMVEGLDMPAIARRMFISESTAKTHRRNLYQFLEAHNGAQAVAHAYERGILGDGLRRAEAAAAEAIAGKPGHRLALIPWPAAS